MRVHGVSVMPVRAHACHGGGSGLGASGLAREQGKGCAMHIGAARSHGELALRSSESVFGSGTFSMSAARLGELLVREPRERRAHARRSRP